MEPSDVRRGRRFESVRGLEKVQHAALLALVPDW
jgi:hypothetical protein